MLKSENGFKAVVNLNDEERIADYLIFADFADIFASQKLAPRTNVNITDSHHEVFICEINEIV